MRVTDQLPRPPRCWNVEPCYLTKRAAIKAILGGILDFPRPAPDGLGESDVPSLRGFQASGKNHSARRLVRFPGPRGSRASQVAVSWSSRPPPGTGLARFGGR